MRGDDKGDYDVAEQGLHELVLGLHCIDLTTGGLLQAEGVQQECADLRKSNQEAQLLLEETRKSLDAMECQMEVMQQAK